jgi:hypothetical protein
MAGFVAVFCLFGQVSSLAHTLLVQHATCAEHGESIHVSDAARLDQTAAGAGIGFADPVVAGSDAGAPAEGHGHDHCLAVAHGRGHVGLRTLTAPVTANPPVLVVVTAETANSRPASCPVYRLAPKNSPPA